MNRILRIIGALLACCALQLRAQNTVFNASFSGDAINPATYPVVTSTTTGWDILSNKNVPASTESDGTLSLNMAGTSSGFFEAQALFANAPVQLLPGTYIELTATFQPNWILTNSSDNLIFGLFNSGSSAPLSGLQSGGLNNALTTFATGGAKNWQGFNANIPLSGSSPKMLNRAAQTGGSNTVQDVLVDSQSSSTGYTTPAGVSASSIGPMSVLLTNGNTYTLDYKLSLSADGLTLTAAVSLYNEVGISGIGSNSLIGSYTGKFSGASLLTTGFDALAIGWRADAGTANPSTLKLLALTVNTTGGAPWFTAEPPSSISVSVGSPLTLAATTGGAVSGYQWQVSTDGGANFVNLDVSANPSAATASLTISNVQFSDAGLYRLVATNAAGSATSTNCTVTVSATAVAPSISVSPIGDTQLSGTSYTFTVTANGTYPLTYQWEKSADNTTFTPIAGATSSSFTIPTLSVSDAGYYRVTVSNVAGSATSTAAQLVVNQALSITSQPASAVLNPAESYTLSVVATGMPAPTYQWQKNGVPISGATSASYTISSASGADTGTYTVVVSNDTGNLTSSAATIAVLAPGMTASSFTPSSSDLRNPDVRLKLTFNETPTPGTFGSIQIHDAATDAVVDSIDLAEATALRDTLRPGNVLATQLLPVASKTIGGITNFHYYPITVSDNTATIYPRNGVLVYGKTYYVTIDAGSFVNASGEAFAGISNATTWRFSTKASGPSAGSTSLTVAADGSGDFDTVQAALDFIPANNATSTVVRVKNGVYFEQIAFQSKHKITLVGEDVDATVIAYPNNNTFNNVPGVYHRGTFFANSVHNLTLANLTINNTTPQNGSQAEAIIINGSGAATANNIVTRCKFNSYQDTVQINKQCYVSDCSIVGDVDFLWGDGPVYLENCDIRIVRSGAYFTQIRNGSGNHGYVFVNCRFTAPTGISGTFLGRIDPGSFPNSEVVVLDSTFGDATNNAFLNTTSGANGSNYLGGWWLLNNATNASSAANVHNWANTIVDANGAPLTDPNGDPFTDMPTDATTQTNYRDATWVLNTTIAGVANGSWTPSLAPIIVVQPTSKTTTDGDSVTFTVQAVGVPEPTYQWRKNGANIPGATSATYTIAHTSVSDADTYSVFVSNSAGDITSDTVTLLVNGGPPVITQQPASQSAFAGTNVNFSIFAVGTGPFTYQWTKNGSPISGATNSTLFLTNVQASDAGSYAVIATNGNGSDTSHPATLSLATPAAGFTPTLPTLPTTIFKVTDFGAVGDNTTDNTAAIAAAVTAAKNAGGGIIEFPAAAGAYMSGPIALSSNMDLQIDGGAILRALPLGLYPNPNTHFITFASGSSNIAITGNGTIDGNGAPWWAGVDSGTVTSRPRLVQFTKETNVLITGVTFMNSPNFNLAFSGANTNVTIFGVSIIAPGNSHNTDGMDLAGTNFLVQNCYVSVGDDNVVAKPGSVFCRNIVVANCTFGTGHGVSIGGQTNVGLDGMLVTDCTFDGTSSALRFKADPTQGGPVQNVTFQNLTMTNVTYPILFYSYYNQLGSPGATSGSSQTTPAKVNTWNATPPNSLASSTIPTWKNVTISNLTVTNGAGYSTIWGLPLADALIANVTLNNVTIQGGAGLELYDATNIQLTGTNSVGPIITANALAITGQPASVAVNAGDTATFTVTAVGGSGTNNTGLTYVWKLNGAALADGPQPDGSSISGATTAMLTVTNARPTSAGAYTATVSSTLDGYDVATNALAPNSLPVSATSAAATLSVNQTYSSWAQEKGLTGANNGPTADPDFDAVPNQLEYVLGLNPLAPDASGLPAGESEGGQLVFRFTHNTSANDVTFTVQQSTDLLTWTPLAASVESSSGTTETLIATLPLTGAKHFVRLSSGAVSTVPVGFMNFTFSTGSTTAFGLPLDDTSPTPIGLRNGRIESLTATKLTNSAGHWTGNLANPAAPWAVRLTSGAAAGRLLDIASNTATTLTVSNASLVGLGVVTGDTFELVPLDTLGTLFGSTALQGGTSSANADVVQVRSGTAWLPYYYNTSLGYWRRTTGPATNANNTVLRPGSAMMLTRRGSSVTLTFVGRVLGTTYRTPIANGSTTAITTGFPLDTTLGGLHLQTLLSGWRSGTATNKADSINLYNGSTWVPYLFNGSYWQTASGTNSDAVALPAGSVLLIQRPSSAAGTTDLVYAKPY
ncbi:MAG TPA: pectinesterase family protein [Opitutaceae bacterium]|nr:pectinesterase family protein [Opitutaceae bacterium]